MLLAVTLQIGRKQFEQFLDVALILLTLLLVSVFHVSLVIVLLTVGPLAVYLRRPSSARELKADQAGTDRK